MDLLFRRYASPFILIDNLIATSGLCDFIKKLDEIVTEERNWEFFLHKIYDKSWDEFKESLKPVVVKDVSFNVVCDKSKDMLKSFTPKI